MLKISKGQKFERLTVVKELDRHILPSGRKYRMFQCKCDCGNITEVYLSNMTRGHTRSCGCIFLEKMRNENPKLETHGMKKTRQYRIWAGMKARCKSTEPKKRKTYLDRGITYCDRWKKFENFWDDMESGYKDNLTIDRIDNNGNYSPENCRWATIKEQCNNMRTNVMVEIDGKSKTISQWSEELGISREKVKKLYL